MPPESNEQVNPAVVVVVARTDPLSPPLQSNTCTVGDVREGSITVIAVEMTCGLLPLREALQPAPVDEEDIGPAVIIEIDESRAAACGLDDESLGFDASIFSRCGDTRPLGDVHKVDLWSAGWFPLHGGN